MKNQLLVTRIFNIVMNEDGYASGIIHIADVPHHAQFVRVKYQEGIQVCDGGTAAQQHWKAFCKLDSECFETIRLPDVQGEWVCVIHPHGK